jgi:putative spermidine/putrescine transport system permease protein
MGTSLKLALLSVLVTTIMGYPVAYSLARSEGKWGALLVSFILLSSFITIAIKALGWSLLLRSSGPINQLLIGLMVVERPIRLIHNFFGALIGMVHFTLPLMILTLASVIQSIPKNLELAAHSLGCSPLRTFFRIVFPLSLPGFVSACFTNFSLCMGLFATPALLGGGKVLTMSILVYQQVVTVSNQPLGAALAFVLLLTVLFINILAAKLIVKRRQF